MGSADSSDEWRPGADDPDSDLSDLEIAAPPARRVSTLGQASMNSMAATAAEDRALTKKNQKERTFKSLVPSTDRQYLLWSSRFDWFRVNTLKQSLTDTPNDYQLERFIDGIVRHIGRRTTTGAAVISVSSLKGAVASIVKHCHFTYKDFSHTVHHRLRIDSTITQLINDGLVTNAQIREPLWITSDLILRMNTAIIKDAMEEGTMSWDYTIFSAMILSLQSALSARAGEIGRSPYYKGEEYLAYKDIDIRWVDTSGGKGKLWCVITLRFEKGKKLDPSNNRHVEISEVENPEFNVCCVIKLILIWALRIGAVQETSWAQLMANIQARASKRVVWVKPDFPLVCGSEPGVHTFRFDTPGSQATVAKSLEKGAKLIGLLAIPATHDIRRGAARELAHLPQTLPGTNEHAARIGLGHSRETLGMDHTDEYVGGSGADTWNMRLRNKPAVLGRKHVLETADEPYRPRKRRPQQVVDEACARFGLDPNSKKDRTIACGRLDKEEHTAWIAEQMRKRDEVHTVTSSGHDGAMPLASSRTAVSSDSNREGASQAQRAAELASSDTEASDAELEPTETEKDELEGETSATELSTLGDSVFDHTGSSQEELLWKLIESTDQPHTLPTSCAPLTGDSDTFGTFFSTINIIKTGKPALFAKLSTPRLLGTSSSRDPPVRYLWSCPNSIFGCTSKFQTLESKEKHFKTCESTSEAAHLEQIQKLKYPCGKGCGKRFSSENSRRTHETQSTTHYEPKRCPKPDCTSDEVFMTFGKLRQHIDAAHRGYTTKSCPVPGCKRAGETIANSAMLKVHLRTVHGWTKQQIEPYMPKTEGSAKSSRLVNTDDDDSE